MSAEFAGTLNQRIQIEAPTIERSPGGLQQPGWEPVADCLAAVVPDGAGSEAEGMALSAMQRFRVTIRNRERVAVGQRVRWGARSMLVKQRIDDPRLPDRIVLKCEEVR